MTKKRNPKSKRVHDGDSGKFISEDKIDGLTPFGYNKATSKWRRAAPWLLLGLVVVAAYIVLPL